ncbi:MAG: SMI1/KNR4 family protein [Micrococcales bacterium]|nr:SMI1/KNR4 family protein [Micrococcales bacterium]MCL2666680.1 SMI1/KNR4 family protein [Micrococcales bacterium]
MADLRRHQWLATEGFVMVEQGRWDAAQIRERLSKVGARPNSRSVFGVNGHRFCLRCPASEEAIATVEQRLGVTLPPSYRLFMSEVSDGGPGPGYGIFPLGCSGNTADDPTPWADWQLEFPSRPFPLDEAWNLPDEEFVCPPGLSAGQEEDWYEAHDKKYFDPALEAGTIPIGHLGCAIWVLLVVAGSRAGEVWIDDRANDYGIYPAEPCKFDDWYLSWLEEVEAKTF